MSQCHPLIMHIMGLSLYLKIAYRMKNGIINLSLCSKMLIVTADKNCLQIVVSNDNKNLLHSSLSCHQYSLIIRSIGASCVITTSLFMFICIFFIIIFGYCNKYVNGLMIMFEPQLLPIVLHLYGYSVI